jgi:uncharacterized membrane protein YqjE
MSELIGLLILAGITGLFAAFALRGAVNIIAPEPDGEHRRQRYREHAE